MFTISKDQIISYQNEPKKQFARNYKENTWTIIK